MPSVHHPLPPLTHHPISRVVWLFFNHIDPYSHRVSTWFYYVWFMVWFNPPTHPTLQPLQNSNNANSSRPHLDSHIHSLRSYGSLYWAAAAWLSQHLCEGPQTPFLDIPSMCGNRNEIHHNLSVYLSVCLSIYFLYHSYMIPSMEVQPSIGA